MVACARLGCRARYIGTVGSDEGGREVEAALKREGIDLSCLRRIDGPNRFAIILVDSAGHRTVIWHRDARIAMPADAVDPVVVADGRVLLVDAVDPDASTAAARAARTRGTPTVVDIEQVRPGVDVLLRSVDVVIASASFGPAYTGATSVGEALRRLMAEFHPALVIAPLGAEGALALHESGEILTPAVTVPVVDTTGAGDAFRGGFVASWLRFGQGAHVETLLRHASAVAALNCGALGAQTGLPRWADVDVLVTGMGYGRSN